MLSREDFYMIKQMRKQGAYIVDIATQVGCSERTVRRYLKYPEPPARKTRHKMAKLKPFMDYIDTRLAENVWNGEVIRHVSWDSYIEVGGNRYSVPESLCGQSVSIRISLDDDLRIYSNEQQVASHRLSSASSGWQTVPEHHAPLWQQVSMVEHRPLSTYEELL